MTIRHINFNNKVYFVAADITKALDLTTYQLTIHAANHLITLSQGEHPEVKRRTRFIDYPGALSLLPISTSPLKVEYRQTLESIISSKASNNSISVFTSPEFGEIRTITIDSEPFFVGKDVAAALGYERTTKAIQDHVEKEDIHEIPIQDSIGRMQKTPFINESGLYSLILSSKLDSAKRFKHWVTGEVLPQIRKTGGYIPVKQEDDEKTILAKALRIVNKTLEEKESLIQHQEQLLTEMTPKADFSDHVSASSELISIKEMADLLSDYGYRYTQNSLFQFLREKKILSSALSNWNRPYREYMDAGYFKIKEGIHWRKGFPETYLKTVVTGSGQQFIYKLAKGA